jgi:hypothetical protein
VKSREIIADNLSKAGWSWAASQPWIPAGEQSGLLTDIAATESVSLFTEINADTAYRTQPSASQFSFLPSWRDFWQDFEKPRSESGRGRFSRQHLPPLSDLQSHN